MDYRIHKAVYLVGGWRGTTCVARLQPPPFKPCVRFPAHGLPMVFSTQLYAALA